MGYFCKCCNINWANLYGEDDEDNDESYDICPICKSDMSISYIENNDNLMWLPLYTSYPIPIGFENANDYNKSLGKNLINKILAKDYESMILKIESDRQLQFELEKQLYKNKIIESEARANERINNYIKNFKS